MHNRSQLITGSNDEEQESPAPGGRTTDGNCPDTRVRRCCRVRRDHAAAGALTTVSHHGSPSAAREGCHGDLRRSGKMITSASMRAMALRGYRWVTPGRL